ncbi:MAG TPA: glycoside hydrolase family 38 C-terminal domain-containing protein [Terriglobales bacterium]|nr:glycoside hydrolase family 38 C-terminal domain-containing protein [Terriglobales bacterium]
MSAAEPAAQNTTANSPQSSTNSDAGADQLWPPDAANLRLHMVGNAHIDAPWLWPLAETNAVVHSTFLSALDRLKEDPDVKMTTSSSQFYEWIADSDPALLDKVRKRVQEGRWDLVGGWWVEPDVNIPNGEALIRQGLYGQRSLKRLFGRTATIGFNPDSFGHTGSIPQILKLQGMPNYVFMRPNATEKQLPSSLFWWQGIDGTKALTFRIPLAYDDPGDVRNHMLREIELLRGQSVRNAMEFYGIGDHGGGPTKANISSIHRIMGEPGAPKLLFSTPDRYFSEVRKASFLNDLPVVTGDMQHHAVGCYTAGSDLKKLNRSTEVALVNAEKFAAIGNIAWGATYPKDDLTKAWKKVLLLQFHDTLGATTLPSYYDAAKNGYARAQDVASDALYLAVQKLAWQVPTVDPDSKYLVVFNPHAWTTNLRIEYDLGWDPKKPTVLEDERGKSIPYQWVQATTTVTNRIGLAAEVQVPAMGYRQIRLHNVPAVPQQPESALRVSDREMENAHLKISFLSDGTLSMLDKDNQKEVLRAVNNGNGGMRAVVLDDPSDTWSHHVRSYDREVGNFALQNIKVVESGPIRGRVRAKYAFGTSQLTIDYLLYATGRDLEARVTLDWHEHQKMLKFAFPVNVEDPKATYEIAYGAMERSTNGDEDPGQRWIDVSGRSGSQTYGLAVVNDAKYGYSANGSEMRVSVARAPVFAHHDPRTLDPGTDYQWMDQGVQSLRILLIPHSGTWQQADPTRNAEKLVTEVPIIYQGIHPGTRALSDSFLEVDAPEVIVSAVKQAEDGNDVIVRAYESTGAARRVRFNLRFAGTTWTGEFKPFEIKTLKVNPRTRQVSEVNALEE